MTAIYCRAFRHITMLLMFVAIALPREELQAHELADRAWPAPDSVVGTSPESIEIMFPDLLAEDGNRIVVQHQRGEVVADREPVVLRDAASSSLSIDLDEDLSNGVYIVRWTAAYAGGWSDEGTFAFTVAAGDATGTTIDADWLAWAGTAMGLVVLGAGIWWLCHRHNVIAREVRSA